MTSSRPEIPLVEPWIDKRELAQIMGISPRTVDRLNAAGMPSVLWGPKTRRYRYSQVERWARQRENLL